MQQQPPRVQPGRVDQLALRLAERVCLQFDQQTGMSVWPILAPHVAQWTRRKLAPRPRRNRTR